MYPSEILKAEKESKTINGNNNRALREIYPK